MVTPRWVVQLETRARVGIIGIVRLFGLKDLYSFPSARLHEGPLYQGYLVQMFVSLPYFALLQLCRRLGVQVGQIRFYFRVAPVASPSVPNFILVAIELPNAQHVYKVKGEEHPFPLRL